MSPVFGFSYGDEPQGSLLLLTVSTFPPLSQQRQGAVALRKGHMHSHRRSGCRSPMWPRTPLPRGVRQAWEPGSVSGSGRGPCRFSARRRAAPPGSASGRGDGCGGHVRRDSSTGLIRPTSLPSGSATIAYRAPQNASNGGCRPR